MPNDPQQVMILPRQGGAGYFSGPTAHAAVSITIPAVAGQVIALPGVIASYAGSGTLAGGNLIVQDGSTTIFTIDIGAMGVYIMPVNLQGTPGNSMTITLADGSANVSGSLNLSPPPFYRSASSAGPFGAYQFNIAQNSMLL